MPFNTFFKHEKVKRALEYGTDAIIMFGLIMLYLQHIFLKQKQLNTLILTMLVISHV